MFTAPLSLFGNLQEDLWLIVTRAGGLLALAFAFRLARRLAGAPYGWLAGATAVLLLLLTAGWVRNAGLGNSEGLLVALLVWAVERHLDGHRDHALLLGFGACLLRPEAWPFFGIYCLWLWRSEPRLRVRSAMYLALIPALWFLPELWGSGDALRASGRAQQPVASSPANADQPWLEVLRGAHRLVSVPLEVLAAAAVGIALLRRRTAAGFRRTSTGERVVLGVAACALAWLALVMAMTQAGYSGNQRYLVPVAALGAVLAGVGLARLLSAAGPSLAPALGAVVVAVTLVALVPKTDRVLDDLNAMRGEAQLYDDLPNAIAAAGGRGAVLRCGMPWTGAYQVTALSWYLDVHADRIGYQPSGSGLVIEPRDPRERRPGPVIPRGLRFSPAGTSREWKLLRDCVR